MVCAMNSLRRPRPGTGRRSQSPNAASRFKTLRAIRSTLSTSSRSARSLTDVTISCNGYPRTPDISDLDGCSRVDEDAVDCGHRMDLHHHSPFRHRSTTISDTSPTTYKSLHRDIDELAALTQSKRPRPKQERQLLQHDSERSNARVDFALPDFLKAEDLPVEVLYTTAEELRQCHDYTRHVRLRTLKSHMTVVAAPTSAASANNTGDALRQAVTVGDAISGAREGDDDDVVLAASSDGVFAAEDEPTPVPSPDLNLVHSTPLRPDLARGGRQQQQHRQRGAITLGPPSTPDTLFFEHDIAVVPDRNGFGLVLSGSAPTHVSRVEALGPAYRAGVHVGDFVLNANGIDVLNSSHDEIARIIMNEPTSVHLVILSRNEIIRPVGPRIFNHPLGCTQLNQCRLTDTLLGPGFDSAISITTQESCVAATDSFVRPAQLSFDGRDVLSAAADAGVGVGIGAAVTLKRRQSAGSLLSQSAPVSPADRGEKPSLLVMTQGYL